MKTIKYIIAAVTITLAFSSCYDLDVAPYDKIAQGNYWKTEANAKSGVMGVYAQLKDYGAYGYMPLFDTYADVAHGPGGPIEQGTYNGAYDFLVQNWQDTYDGVQRVNTVIKNVSGMAIDEKVKSNILGEAHFLRALYYFHLTDLFGGVPIYDESWEVSESFNEMLLPRNSREEVWKFIIKDLTFAITNLPLKWDASDYGRATKGAAYALRGKTYLYIKDWKKSIDDFEEIVYNKTNQYGYKLYPDYPVLFTSAGPIPNDNETLFAIQNKGTTDNPYGMPLCTLYGTRGAYGGGRATCMPSVTMADMYEEKDGKKFDWNNYIPGYNESDAVKKSTFHATLNSTKQKLETMPDTTLLGKMYRGRDPRMMQSLIVPYSYYDGYIVGAGPKKQLYAIAAGTTVANGFIQNDRGWNVYFYRKFVPIGDMGGEITNRNYTPINFPIIRLADVLLMLAEAYNEENQLDKAVIELNKVRKRQSTNMPALNSGPAWLQVSDKEEMFERIIHERAVELVGEGHRFSDLRRWGLGTQFLNTRQEKDFTGEIRFTRKFSDRDYLWPVPSEEIQRNPALKPNNPGW